MMRFSAFAATIIASVNFIASSAFAYHGTFRGNYHLAIVLWNTNLKPDRLALRLRLG